LAFATLGNNGQLPLARDHSCSECTKPYKAPIGVDKAVEATAAPVNMIVMDGIVMGPVVSVFFIELCGIDINYF